MQLFVADDFSRRVFQIAFFVGALMVNIDSKMRYLQVFA